MVEESNQVKPQDGWYWFRTSSKKSKWRPCEVREGWVSLCSGFLHELTSNYMANHAVFGPRIDLPEELRQDEESRNA